MVVKKSVENEATGFHVPIIPRARRSVRARCAQKKIVNDNQMCAIEILASLAGKLLQESESSSACSNVSEENNNNNNIAIGKDAIKQEIQEGEKPSKAECMDQGTESKLVLEQSPVTKSSLGSEKECGEMKPICHSNNGSSNKEASDSFRNEPSSSLDYKNEARRKQNSGSQTKKPLWWKPISNASGSRHDHDDTKLCSRDDDDNFSIYNKASKNFKHPQRIGDDRIRKLLTSKYWKASPKLKDFEPSKTYGGMQPFYRKRKTCFNWERSHRDSFYKRRKLFDRRSVINSDGIYCSESITSSPRKGMNDDENGLPEMLCGANGVSSSMLGHQASFHTKESHVKFSIKSFKIPELLIEVPQTTTVGSLKRTVMEAVTAILEGGLHVGVLFQGKKIRDDSRTLLQSGISCKDNTDTLGFTLEPNSLQAPQITDPEEPPLISQRVAPQLLTRSTDNPVLNHPRFPDALRDQPLLLTGVSNNVENNLSHPNIVADKMMPESGALVPVPPISPKPLAVVPLNQKNRRSDMARRRIRRPFSVSEVEALVQAVEQLGTGRWRDVKLCAFDNADHRTYVDLKDKWKTLVHTASIAPQQRRGEPVPQELLDRVLSAHAYWSQYQAKQGGKHQAASLKIAEDRAGLKASKPCEV